MTDGNLAWEEARDRHADQFYHQNKRTETNGALLRELIYFYLG